MTRRDWIAVAVLVAAFGIAVIAVDPRANFPLDDDWDFAFPTWTLARTGVIQHTPFNVAIGVLQYEWGALWTLVFGESFNVLRASTLTLALASMLLLFVTLRRVGVATALASLAAAALFFHPLIFWASFTYMTHVPELFVSLVAMALLVEALRRDSAPWLVAAAAAAVSTCLIRQTGIVNVAAPLIGAIAFRRSLGERWKRIAAVYAVAMTVTIALVTSGSLLLPNEQTQMHLEHSGIRASLTIPRIVEAWHTSFFNLQYAALFFLPLVCLIAARRARMVTLIVVTVVFGGAAADMIRRGILIPYPTRGNAFVDFGIGPLTMRDSLVLLLPPPHRAGTPALMLLMCVSTVLAIIAGAWIVNTIAARDMPFIVRVAALYCACGTAMHALLHLYFDRYSIDTMWPLAIAIPVAAQQLGVPRPVRRAAIAAVLVLALFSIGGTAEYLDWNRARWSAYRWLTSHGVTLEQMDAGYEINALLALRRGTEHLDVEGFGVVDDRFIIAFRPVRGYRVIRSFPYKRVFGLSRGEVLVEVRE